ncbi:hypothetical protein ACN28S_44470 [Cystobacter fuscus]
MRLFFVISLLLLSVLPLGGCNRPSYETPVRAYQTFLRAVQRGDAKPPTPPSRNLPRKPSSRRPRRWPTPPRAR